MTPEHWTPKFRIEVVNRLAQRIESLANDIMFVTRATGGFLTSERDRLEAGMGCTLEDVWEETPHDS